MSICVGATSNDLGKLPLLLDGRWVGVEAAKLCIFYNQSAWVAVFFFILFYCGPSAFYLFFNSFCFWLKLYMHVGSWKFITFEGGVWNFCGLPSPANWNHKHYLKKRKGWSKVGLLAIRWGKNKCGSATLFDLLIGSFRIPGKSDLFEFRLRGELIFLNFFITNTMIHLKRMLLWCVSLHVSQVHINNYM